MPLIATQRPKKTPGAIRNCAMDFDGSLAPGEVIETAAVVELGTSDLTISGAGPTTAEHIILDERIPLGRAAQWQVSGGTRGKLYRLRVTVETDGQQTIEADCFLEVV
jgi:hypothetical protein